MGCIILIMTSFNLRLLIILSAMNLIAGERIAPGAIALALMPAMARCIIGVIITPGQTALIRIPEPPYSTAAVRVS
jgi:hypothetical protein